MEASAIPASVGLARTRIALGVPLLRIRTDEQLVSLFRAGSDDAFRVIHDRYRARMFAYARQMLATSSQDPEDAVQEIFVRAYYGLRATDRRLALRAWLYRIAHNRCVDDLRRPQLITCTATQPPVSGQDPVVKVEQRDALRRLISDVQRLPEQQRSALLMRELSGMPYNEVSGALGVSVPAVKSLLVRARVSLAQASEARDTACADIRADIILAHDRGVRTSGLARRHIRDCQGCRAFRTEVRGVSRQLAALTPTMGPFGLIANLLGWGGGGAAAGSGALAGGGTAVGSGAATSAGLLTGSAGHVVTLLAAAVVTAGGAVEVQSTLTVPPARHAHHQRAATSRRDSDLTHGAGLAAPASPPTAGPSPAVAVPSAPQSVPSTATSASTNAGTVATALARALRRAPLTETLDPDMYLPRALMDPSANGGGTSSGTATSTPTSSGTATGTAGSTTGTAGSTGQPAGTATTSSTGGATSSTLTSSSGGSSSSTSSGSTAGSSTSAGSGGSAAATTSGGA